MSAPIRVEVGVDRLCDWMRAMNYSKETIRSYRVDLACLASYLTDVEGIDLADQVTREVLTRFQGWLYGEYRARDGMPLAIGTQRHILAAVRALFAYLARERLIASDPSTAIELPRVPRRLPRDILSLDEVEALLAAPNVATLLGLRDRAILEVFYGAGVRKSELFDLSIYDVDLERAELRIEAKKRGESRVIPIPPVVAQWVRRYIEEVRPSLLGERSGDALFLSRQRRPFRSGWIVRLIRKYVQKATITKDPKCHGMRHTYGSHLVRAGMGIRQLQKLLGHRWLSSTQIYTQLDPSDVRDAFHKAHPRSRGRRQSGQPRREP